MTNEKIDQAKGRVEQAAGDLTGDDELKAQGERHETGGKLKEAISGIKDKVDGAIDAVQEKLDKKNDTNE